MTLQSSYKQRRGSIHIVRAQHQFGPDDKPGGPYKLFLDDARNPPRDERGWVVVRTVEDGLDFLWKYGHLVSEASLDNDLGPDPQGIELLKWILHEHRFILFPLLKTIKVHTSNLPQGRKMMRMLRGSPFKSVRVDAHERVYPRASTDPRKVIAYTAV